MPTYDFRCLKCDRVFERTQSVRLEPPPCPLPDMDPDRQDQTDSCAGETVRLISGSAFHLKGSGWAKDGYS